MSEFESSENLSNPEAKNHGVFAVDISEGSDSVAKLDGQIIIDARPQIDEKTNKHWVPPEAFQQMGNLFRAIRRAYERNEDMNLALTGAAKKLGFDVKDAQAIGKPPSHWKKLSEQGPKYRKA